MSLSITILITKQKMANQPIFYIFVNSDLELSKGQTMAQISHITHVIVEDLIKKCYEVFPTTNECLEYMRWKIIPTTVILKATNNQLKDLIKRPGAKGFIDSGNRIPDNSLTVVGFYPNSTMGDIVKDYKLL